MLVLSLVGRAGMGEGPGWGHCLRGRPAPRKLVPKNLVKNLVHGNHPFGAVRSAGPGGSGRPRGDRLRLVVGRGCRYAGSAYLEVSPSQVYGARLLSGFGASTPSRVQIPPPPRWQAPPPDVRGRRMCVPRPIGSRIGARGRSRRARNTTAGGGSGSGPERRDSPDFASGARSGNVSDCARRKHPWLNG